LVKEKTCETNRELELNNAPQPLVPLMGPIPDGAMWGGFEGQWVMTLRPFLVTESKKHTGKPTRKLTANKKPGWDEKNFDTPGKERIGIPETSKGSVKYLCVTTKKSSRETVD